MLKNKRQWRPEGRKEDSFPKPELILEIYGGHAVYEGGRYIHGEGWW